MMRKVLIFSGILLAIIISMLMFADFPTSPKVPLLMTRDEVERIHGKGPDPKPQCFGCQLNFIYPQLKLSGLYSDTLGKVKQMTTADRKVSIFNIHLGDTFEKAVKILETKGYILQSDSNPNYHNYYYKDDFYIRLWTDDEIDLFNKKDDYMGEKKAIIRSITFEIRVKKDEEIRY
ncbi:hypothetical protein SD71_21165 [Cohnella kolymensis]|uniref:Uncharacterized protein n=1 Tax=Cohnella kolymensis TaxID=1590652 RepID=A0ABR4ZZC9_9BACL|nr:hypothetical protein [Cohnella kolymensis]KIL34179.1 hypothetical protein SD71_21165 [Cohnella kolymensis]